MLYHVGPHGEAPSFGHEAEAGVRPEPLGVSVGKAGQINSFGFTILDNPVVSEL